MLTPEQQAAVVGEAPDIFVPIAGGWGRMGATHIRLAAANEETLAGALHDAWKLRVEKNARTARKSVAQRGDARVTNAIAYRTERFPRKFRIAAVPGVAAQGSNRDRVMLIWGGSTQADLKERKYARILAPSLARSFLLRRLARIRAGP